MSQSNLTFWFLTGRYNTLIFIVFIDILKLFLTSYFVLSIYPALLPFSPFLPSFELIVSSPFLGEGNGTHSGTLAWKIPWMEEPGGLQSMGSLRVGHD